MCDFSADEFWKNLFTDVQAYADHRGRAIVDESDMFLLLQR